MKVVILAAGMGHRLGDADLPKPLTRLDNGKSILELQIETLSQFISIDQILLVIGYRKEIFIDSFPNLLFVYNSHFAKENTSKSLLRALSKFRDDVLWINGDVVFHKDVLKAIFDFKKTCMVVNQGSVGEEEVKYRQNSRGRILEVSKSVLMAQGEALGINFFKAKDAELLKRNLEKCEDKDYFEKGIELAIQEGLKVWSVPIPQGYCTEIDFAEDLARANAMIRAWQPD
jgi:L-glutamine-phosphate cytidylyltransferase